ncbi:hypothetical protein IFM89_010666 [Coptis chinensis]|uniref:RanBP2-type domain-containing protein n=1 Tax=Coptis chinensis TaxID=261450 RepID=A0A835HDR7_9MAGN|nr:hypothetical protein IFM89_010666 [Coptis chinensis]
MGGTSKLLMLLSCPFPLLYPRPSALRLVLHSRVSAATLSSLSKRRFHYDHCPRLGFSVNSSSQQHIHSSVNTDDYKFPTGVSVNSRDEVSHLWPEWSNLLDNLRLGGYFDRQDAGELNGEDAFSVFENLSEDFVRAAGACLSFAHERSHLLGSLSRKDIEVVVENGSPFLFKSVVDSSRRMKSFLGYNQSNEFAFERAGMVDLMRFLLTYAYNCSVSDQTNFSNEEKVEYSVRNLLRELAYESRAVQEPDISASMPNQLSDRYGQTSTPLRQNIEMKRGDWICSKCSFMNFARNMKCLECNEIRPKRQLTGGEWDCPQCDFFNYGKNAVCLRCECKRPGGASGIADSRFGFDYNKNESRADTLNTRTIPLQQNMVNARYQGTLGNTGTPKGNTYQPIDSVDPNLDRMIGWTSQGSKSDMFNQSHKSKVEEEQVPSSVRFADKEANDLMSPGKYGASLPLSRRPVSQTESGEDKEQAEKSERWFKKVAELHDVSDLASAIPDEDFPEIMPMRKGENRFVISKKKDRSLTSPLYKRRMAMEQTNSTTNFVPFVPFPPDYFAKKDKVPETEASTGRGASGASATPEIQGVAEKSEGVLDSGAFRNSIQSSEYQQRSNETWDTSYSAKMPSENRVNYSYGGPGGTPTQAPDNLRGGSRDRWSGSSWEENGSSAMSATGNSSQQPQNAQSTKESWKSGFQGKSLEGSLVKEPDPLDMSEEAKAERWFRRAAQIKDISELSQIPDSDFPTIMPMRKGVNRFVVSKRKTPLERRLTSPQYRRNLPIVSSEPVKNENTEG